MIKQLLLVGVLVAGSVGAIIYIQQEAEVVQVEATEVDLNEENGIMPIDREIVSWETLINVVQFTDTWNLTKSDGKYVNFWVENIGNSAIYIDINGQDETLIQPGKSDYAQIDISGLFTSSKCTFNVRTAANDRISINYRIAQRK